MSNGEVCCILGICCPAGSAAQLDALIHEIQKARPALTPVQAHRVAITILARHGYFSDIALLLDATSPPP